MDERIIEARLKELDARCVASSTPVIATETRLVEYLDPGSYRDEGAWKPFSSPARWPAGRTVRVRFTLPDRAPTPGASPYLSFDGSGWEGLLTFDGHPFGGIDANHRRIPLESLADSGRGASLEAEFVSLPRVWCEPSLARETSILFGIALEEEDRELRAAVRDFAFSWKAVGATTDGYRAARVRELLETALREVDLARSRDEIRRESLEAHRRYREALASIENDSEGVRVLLTGHSHIDVAWLWPLRETVRKCARTFSTACRLLETDDHYVFSCSQPQLYEYTKEHYPSLYEEIRRWIDRGRWAVSGGMWVESDCNVPSGESLIRQILQGVRFFETEFGKRPTTCWLPDVFGYPATLPQILAGCGLTAFYTNKLHWQSRNPFPGNLFLWEGTDGTRIRAHIPKLLHYYNGFPEPSQLAFAVEHFKQKHLYDEVMLPFGHGDGGGGPTEEMVAFARLAEEFPGVPRSRTASEEEYFRRVDTSAVDLPVWSGELYLETHRGTFTSQAEVKRRNRRSETLLRQAEMLELIAPLAGAGDTVSLTAEWRKLLLLQFHDILPGSSIGRVYEEAAATYDEIATNLGIATTGSIGKVTVESPADTGVVFNSLSWRRNDPVVIRVPKRSEPVEAVWEGGSTTPMQWVDTGIADDSAADDAGSSGGYYLTAGETLAPLAMTGLSFRRTKGHDVATAPVAITTSRIENDRFLIELDRNGEITRLRDKADKREVIPAGERANRLELFQDGPEREAAWNVHDTFPLRRYEFDSPARIEVVERGPVRWSLEVIRTYRETTIRQRISVYQSTPRIDFATEVDWRERQTMLKAAFPVLVRTDRAAFEIQLGTVERPTHTNTSWDEVKFEVPCHRWIDLSEHGYGVSLLNDSKYGADVRGHTLRLTLLRGPEYPDPDADRGLHRFVYSLCPHRGTWREAETVLRGWELNEPPLFVPGRRPLPEATRPLFEIEGPALLSAAKRAEDGNGYILRLYEPHGGRGTVTVRLAAAATVTECNHIEEALAGPALAPEVIDAGSGSFAFETAPCQIRSFRVVPR